MEEAIGFIESNIVDFATVDIIKYYTNKLQKQYPTLINVFGPDSCLTNSELYIYTTDEKVIKNHKNIINTINDINYLWTYIGPNFEDDKIDLIAIPCSIQYNNSHSVLIFIDKSRKKIIYFNSHGDTEDNIAFCDIIMKIKEIILNIYNQTYETICNIIQVQNNLGICSYYCLLFQYLYVINYNDKDIINLFDKIIFILKDVNKTIKKLRIMLSSYNKLYYIPNYLTDKNAILNPDFPRFNGALNLNLPTNKEQIYSLLHYNKPFIIINESDYSGIGNMDMYKRMDLYLSNHNNLCLVYHKKHDDIIQSITDINPGILQNPLVLGLLMGFKRRDIDMIPELDIEYEMQLLVDSKCEEIIKSPEFQRCMCVEQIGIEEKEEKCECVYRKSKIFCLYNDILELSA